MKSVKKILAVLLSVGIVGATALSVSAFDGDISHEILENTDTSKVVTNERISSLSYAFVDEIIDRYVKEHLYTFTREQVLEQYIKDMVQQHPEQTAFMLNMLLGTMDKYSAYHPYEEHFLDPDDVSKGYGFLVTEENEQTKIIKVYPDSKAKEAGFLEGDIIIGINGLDVSHTPWNVTAGFLKNPAKFFGDENGNELPITITVRRGDAVMDFPYMTRGAMTTGEISEDLDTETGVAYVQIDGFLGDTLVDDFIAVLEKAQKVGCTKLTIDLRNNGGGSFEKVLEMTEVLLEPNTVMCYVDAKSLPESEKITSSAQRIPFDSIAVLVNENTASAAELMASVLHLKADAVLVGHTTYGKALGQTVSTFANGDTVTITSYQILDANGASYNDVGLTPDFIVEPYETLYDFPSNLFALNEANYVDIVSGVYSDATYALEQRLYMFGLLFENEVDGVWDNETALAYRLVEQSYFDIADGIVTAEEVDKINQVAGSYRLRTDYYDAPYDVASAFHVSYDNAVSALKKAKRAAITEQMRIEDMYDSDAYRAAD